MTYKIEDSIMEFWKEMQSSSKITFKDIETLTDLLGKLHLKVGELRTSRDLWHNKFLELIKKIKEDKNEN